MDGGCIAGDDGVVRCPWAVGDPLMQQYHDDEWGVPLHGEQALFERITLEAFQAGLSWRIVLAKRPALRAAFRHFDPDAVAAMDGDDVTRLLADPGIIRNRAKIEATVRNARATVALRADGGIDALVWAHAPAVPPPAPTTLADLPAVTPESRRLAAAFKAHGFAFVGPTTAYATMQAAGLVDDHLACCHRRSR